MPTAANARRHKNKIDKLRSLTALVALAACVAAANAVLAAENVPPGHLPYGLSWGMGQSEVDALLAQIGLQAWQLQPADTEKFPESQEAERLLAELDIRILCYRKEGDPAFPGLAVILHADRLYSIASSYLNPAPDTIRTTLDDMGKTYAHTDELQEDVGHMLIHRWVSGDTEIVLGRNDEEAGDADMNFMIIKYIDLPTQKLLDDKF